MRRLLALVCIVAFAAAGCVLPTIPDEPYVPPSHTGLSALAVMESWVANQTTTDADEGARWADGEWVLPNGSKANHSFGLTIYVASAPYVTYVDGIDGAADWARVYDMFQDSEVYMHPAYRDLVFHAIHGEYFPEHYDDGAVDGVARHWEAQWTAEWSEGAQGEWATEFHDGEYGDAVSWAMFSFGGTGYVCPDRATERPAMDSDAAFATALATPAFAAVHDAHPDGELWLKLIIQDAGHFERGPTGLEFVCPAAQDPIWSVRWMDLNATLAGQAPYVDVRIDAVSGDVVDVHRSTFRPPESYEWETVLDASDTTVGDPQGASWTFDVPEDQVRLSVYVSPDDPVAGTTQNDENDYRLIAPDGTTHPIWRFALSWTIDVTHPEAGTWTLERTPIDGYDTMHVTRSITGKVVG